MSAAASKLASESVSLSLIGGLPFPPLPIVRNPVNDERKTILYRTKKQHVLEVAHMYLDEL